MDNMSSSLSIDLDHEVVTRLDSAAALARTTSAALAASLVDEGLRSMTFPRIVFRDGPSGRRAGVASGPDVWELVSASRATDIAEDVAVLARQLSLSAAAVQEALVYYDAFSSEIDAEIADNENAAQAGLAEFRVRQSRA